MKPKYNDLNCVISKQGFTRSDLPNQIRNETSIGMRMTKQRPLLEAQNFHHKLQILLKAIIGCKTSSVTHRSHDYFQYDQRAYHCIAAFNGVIEPQKDGCLHWHIMIYLSVLSPELLEIAAAASSMELQSQISKMLDSITCTTVPCDIHQWYNDLLSSVEHGSKCPRGADIKVPNASSNYDDLISIWMKKSILTGLHGHGFCCKKGKKENTCAVLCSNKVFIHGTLVPF
jgi:hypothetical protein